MDKQDAPFAVQIEPVEGCNLSCTFCGLNGIREKAGGPYKFMELDTADRIASQIKLLGWTPRIEFAMHGEPTMHPKLADIIRIFKQHLPRHQLMLTSNGGGLLKGAPESTLALFDAGLAILALDDYNTVSIVEKLLSKLPPTLPVKNYPSDGLELSPHKRFPPKTKMVIVIEDIVSAAGGGHSTLNNHCGAGSAKNNKAVNKRCAKPFRELAFRWDGNVSVCCNDFRGQYKIGNINDMSLDALWNAPRFWAARRMLLNNQRSHGVCKGCDALSTRVGLLPDKFGKQKVGPFTAGDAAVMDEAMAGDSYAPIVFRSYEK